MGGGPPRPTGIRPTGMVSAIYITNFSLGSTKTKYSRPCSSKCSTNGQPKANGNELASYGRPKTDGKSKTSNEPRNG